MTDAQEVYKAYPRHIGKRAAENAIVAAMKRIQAHKESPCGLFASADDVLVYLLARTRLFANSPAGHANGLFEGYMPPYPATWFNRSSYLDEESEWSGNGQTEPPKVCDKHPGSGLTNWGSCWTCYSEQYRDKSRRVGAS